MEEARGALAVVVVLNEIDRVLGAEQASGVAAEPTGHRNAQGGVWSDHHADFFCRPQDCSTSLVVEPGRAAEQRRSMVGREVRRADRATRAAEVDHAVDRCNCLRISGFCIDLEHRAARRRWVHRCIEYRATHAA